MIRLQNEHRQSRKPRLGRTMTRQGTLLLLGAIGILTLAWGLLDYQAHQQAARATPARVLAQKRELIRDRIDRAVEIVTSAEVAVWEDTGVWLESQLQTLLSSTRAGMRAELEAGGALTPTSPVAQFLQNYRFSDDGGFVFLVDTEGTVLVHSTRPDLCGQRQLEFMTPDSRCFFEMAVEYCAAEGLAWLSCEWPAPGAGTPDTRTVRAYARAIPDTPYVLGVARYLDVEVEAAQERAKEHLGAISFADGEGYIFVATFDGRLLLNRALPELVGENIWNFTDSNGVKLVQELIAVAQQPGGGFVEYTWQKPDSDTTSLKLSYARGVPEWGWMVGTGLYLDEIGELVAAEQNVLRQRLAVQLSICAGLGALLLLVSTVVWRRLHRATAGELRRFEDFFERAERHGERIDPATLRFAEFELLGQAVNRMLDARRLADDAWRQAAEEQRLLLSTIDTQVWYLLDAEHYGMVNAAHARFVGCTPKELERRSLREAYPPDVAAERIASNENVIRTGRTIRTEEWFENAAGERRLLAVTKTPALDETGAVRYIVCSATDVTEHQRIQAALQTRQEELEKRSAELEESRRIALSIMEDAEAARGATQRALRTTETILEAIPVGVVLVGDDRRVRHANHAACEMIGVDDPASLAGTSCQDSICLHGDGTCPILDRGEAIDNCERRLTTIDGRELPILKTVIPIDLEGERVLLEAFVDISRMKAAEQALADQRALLASLVDSIPDIVFYKDLDGVYFGCNPAFEAFVGRPRDEIIGRSDIELFEPELAAFFRMNDQRALESGTLKHNDEWITYPNGRRALLDTLKTPYRGPNGELLGVLGISRDVTERKQIEDALRTERGLFVGGPTIVFKWRAAGHNDWDVAYVSPNVHPQLGYPPEELMSGRMRYPELVHPEDIARVFRELDENFAEGREHFEQEYRLRHRDGSYRWVYDFTTVVRDENGHVTEMNGYVLDMTARRAAEEALREATRLAESATRSKSEFLANMSHEIRTPMTAILGYIELIAEGCEHKCGYGGSADMDNSVATIRRNGEHLLQIINDILDISKIEAGKLDVERIACNPLHVLSDVQDLMQVRAEAKRIELQVRCLGPVPTEIHSDPLRLKQILVNLIGNAIKFTEVGSVVIEMRQFNSAEKGAQIEIQVRDTGVGMTDDEVARLFHPFVQADTSTTRRFGGTGLGLTISKRLAETLGGDITVTSTPGQGSCFVLRIATGNVGPVKLVEPADNVQSWHRQAERPANDDERTRIDARVLLVEDGPDNQRLIASLLRKGGATVDIADNGEVGMRRARAAEASGTPYDVILMDMQMPVVDGYEATRGLRAAGYTRPIIALTAHAMDQDRQRCLAVGCNDYITKPVTRAGLIAAIAAHLTADASAAPSGFVEDTPD
jgi:PAS domain S-box-containing protein